MKGTNCPSPPGRKIDGKICANAIVTVEEETGTRLAKQSFALVAAEERYADRTGAGQAGRLALTWL